MITIEIVYIPLDKTVIHMTLALDKDTTVLEALNVSGIYVLHPETRRFVVGIFAKQVSLEHKLKDHDRIEIYRPLILDPKENRRKKHVARFNKVGKN